MTNYQIYSTGDELFETVSHHLLQRKQQLFDKFRVLLLKQSMVCIVNVFIILFYSLEIVNAIEQYLQSDHLNDISWNWFLCFKLFS